MRIFWTRALVIGGIALQLVSCFYWAAPLGVPTSPAYSNPVVPIAALIFVLGVMMMFTAALVYELIPGEE